MAYNRWASSTLLCLYYNIYKTRAETTRNLGFIHIYTQETMEGGGKINVLKTRSTMYYLGKERGKVSILRLHNRGSPLACASGDAD